MANLRYGFDARTCFRNTETVAGQYLLITLGMQLRETGREFKLFSVDIQRTVRPFLALHRISRQTSRINAQEVTHTRFLQLQISGNAIKTHHMNDIFLHRTEHPLQHIVEVNTDIGCNTATLMYIAFPTRIVPVTATRDIGQVHIVDLILRPFVHFFFQRPNLIVQT